MASYRRNGADSFGIVVGNEIIDLGTKLGGQFGCLADALAPDGLAALAQAADGQEPDCAVADVELMPVIPQPAKIFCIGLNYEMHRKETGQPKADYPTIFTRFADTLVGHGAPIIKPAYSDYLDFEGELAVIIGQGGRHITRDRALDHVAGYACYNDASVRDWQRHTGQFTPGKNFPSTGGFGPWMVTQDEAPDIEKATITTHLNGDEVQSATIDDLIFPVPELIAYLSTFTALAPGDVISTGTPGGVGFMRDPQLFMKPGDEVVVEIAGVGKLANPIAAESV